MDRLQNTDLSATPPEPTTGETGYPRVAVAGQYAASNMHPYYLYMLIEEMRNVIVAAGIDPSFVSLDQLVTAIETMIQTATPDSAETVKGLIRRATVAETVSGLVTDAAATPAGVKAAIEAVPSGLSGARYTSNGTLLLPSTARGVLVFGVGGGGGGGAGGDNGSKAPDGSNGGNTVITTDIASLILGGGKGGIGGGQYVDGVFWGRGGARGTATLNGVPMYAASASGDVGTNGNPARGGDGANSPFGNGGVGKTGSPTNPGGGSGAGGAGGWGQDNSPGGGGGSGAYVSGVFVPASPGSNVTITIGGAGAGAPPMGRGEGGNGVKGIAYLVPVTA